MALQRTSAQNVYLDRGNSLAIYIDGTTGTLMLKDSNGITQPVSDYISGASGNYIQNQNESSQNADFWINGKGTFGSNDFPGSQTLNVRGCFNLFDENQNIIIQNGSFNTLGTAGGGYNVMIGTDNFLNNTEGQGNIGIGQNVLLSNLTGNNNIAIGFQSLYNQTSAEYNISIGINSQAQGTTANSNVTIGTNALGANLLGSKNTIIGNLSCQDSNNVFNTIAIGYGNNTSGFNRCLILGNNAIPTYEEQIVIGSDVNPLGKIAEATISSSHTLEILLNGELYRILMRKVIP